MKKIYIIPQLRMRIIRPLKMLNGSELQSGGQGQTGYNASESKFVGNLEYFEE